jgi:hypothetical protein
VLAVARDHRITTGAGTFRADELAARLPSQARQRHSAGRGAKGQRWYDWALIDTVDEAADPDGTGHHWLLIRRNRRTGELAFYRAYSPTPVPLAVLVHLAGQRWKIEESFQSGRSWLSRRVSWLRRADLDVIHAALEDLSESLILHRLRNAPRDTTPLLRRLFATATDDP